MESTASAGDSPDTDADSRTMDVQHDDDESPATTGSEKSWYTTTTDVDNTPDMDQSGTLTAALVLTKR
ncbi:hypothetical protein MRX96_045121 [Rhipicephalus microplus]